MLNTKFSKIQELLLWETASDAIVVFDEFNMLLYANKSSEYIFGYTPEELVGCNISKIQSTHAAKMHEEGIKRYLQTGQKKLNWKAARATGIHKNGSEIALEISFSHLCIDSENYFAGFIRNIQDRVDDEEKIKKVNADLQLLNDELRKTNEELDHFVYKASHDLRAPLLTILGLVNIGKIEDSIETYRAYTELIGKTVRKLDVFIYDILDYSRNIRTQLTFTKIEVKKIIEDIIAQMSHLPNFNKIEFRVDVDEDYIFTDEARLKIILSSLISNSIRYQNQLCEVPYVLIQIKKVANQIEIYIVDNGIGIHPEQINKIFDMFYKASEYSTGAGIGLYLVKEVVKKLNGTIEVNSDLYIKTIFKITIPNRSF